MFKSATIFDGMQDQLIENYDILIVNNIIAKIGQNLNSSLADNVINVRGKVIIPGLIDAHVHVTAAKVDLYQDHLLPAYIYARSFEFMKKMLHRGFTSIRDAGGADAGINQVVQEQLIDAPRLFMSGKALSQTAGHGDFRKHTDHMEPCACSMASGSSISILCDGVSAVRKAAREQLRQGATQIKIMAGGGVTSPTDRVTDLQFSDEEIVAIVEEAKHFGTYVMAHAYTPKAMQRCIELGVHSLEHGNLLDEETAKLMKQHGVYLVPTLSIYEALSQQGASSGTPENVLQKLKMVREKGLQAIQYARKHGVSIGFGTDLLGDFHQYQTQEFLIRSQVETPFQTLQSATSINAKMIGMADKLGVIAENAYADLLVINGNPLTDISLLSNSEQSIQLIMKDGKIIMDKLCYKQTT